MTNELTADQSRTILNSWQAIEGLQAKIQCLAELQSELQQRLELLNVEFNGQLRGMGVPLIEGQAGLQMQMSEQGIISFIAPATGEKSNANASNNQKHHRSRSVNSR